MKTPNYPGIMRDILHLAVASRAAELTEYVSTETANTVQSGPFKGMLLSDQAVWGNGDILPKLLGTYEQELHDSIELAISRSPKIILNVGAAEGYYAIGLALRLPGSTVHTFDTAGTSVLLQACALNDIEITWSRFQIHASFRPELLYCWEDQEAELFKGLIVMDIEGDEVKVLTPCRVRKLINTDVIVECHDFKEENATQRICELFAPTHDVCVIREGPRDPAGIPLLQGLSNIDRSIAVSEGRPQVMRWVVAWSRMRGSVRKPEPKLVYKHCMGCNCYEPMNICPGGN